MVPCAITNPLSLLHIRLKRINKKYKFLEYAKCRNGQIKCQFV